MLSYKKDKEIFIKELSVDQVESFLKEVASIIEDFDFNLNYVYSLNKSLTLCFVTLLVPSIYSEKLKDIL